MMLMQCFSVVFFFLIFFIKAYDVGTHLNCINPVNAIQMGIHIICLYIVGKKYTGCNLKTMELFDCVLIGLCAVIRVHIHTP